MSVLQLADPAASWAVLAGVSDYEHRDLLPAVANNVSALSAVLANPSVWGLPRDRIDTVEPENVRDEFIAKVGAAARTATDTLVVYYAGHGLTDSLSDELYLGLPGTEQGYIDTALRYEFLARRLAAPTNTVQHITVILDCCYSGRAARGRMSAGEDLAEHATIRGHCVFTASSSSKTAQAPVGAHYTAFTGVLLDLLERGIPGEAELLTVAALHQHAYRRLRRQAPELGTRGSTSVVCFARNTAPVPPRPIPLPGEPTKPIPGTESKLPPGMPVLVRKRLEQMPKVIGFRLAQPGPPEPSAVAKARKAHPLAADEELIAVWQWKRSILNVLFPPNSLAFTSHGIRISDTSNSLFVPYADFSQYEFSCERLDIPWSDGSVNTFLETFSLKLTSPAAAWSSPYLKIRWDVYQLAAALTDIRQMTISQVADT
jgi:hypothetical protein